MGRGRDGEGLVRAGEVAPRLPDAARGPDPRHAAAGPLRGSRLLEGAALRAAIEQRARSLGFDLVRVTTPDAIPDAAERLSAWLAAGHQAEMGWMSAEPERRAKPAALWSDVRSVVMLGTSYAPPSDPREGLARRDSGLVAAYAARRDYHDVLKGRLKEVAGYLGARSGAAVKVFVDTAPVMEKPLAAAAGLGWIGKHSVLVSREHGGWLLLGAIFTTALLAPDAPEPDHCGSCTRCLDVCPTDAFPAPYRLDARRCIAYLTIEHPGHIPAEFREAIGNRVFGCDDCLAVCPWNRFAAASRDARLAFREDLAAPPLAALARLDDAAFRQRFAGTPVKRTGRDRVVRNALVAIGNSGDPTLAAEAVPLLDDPAPIVRAMAVWALGRLWGPERIAAFGTARRALETDADVRREWDAACGGRPEAAPRCSTLSGASPDASPAHGLRPARNATRSLSRVGEG